MKLQLFHPVKFIEINQNFTENKACIKIDGTLPIVPRTEATCPAGYESIYTRAGMKGHNGLDIGAANGQPVFAALEGMVLEIQTEPERGLGLGIISQQKYYWNDAFSHADGNTKVKVRYWHLQGFNVVKGQVVKVGDLIGWADTTGYATGPHLHFEVKPVEIINDGVVSDDNYRNILQDNGMFGAIDPLPYMQNFSAAEQSDILVRIQLMLDDIGNIINKLKNDRR